MPVSPAPRPSITARPPATVDDPALAGVIAWYDVHARDLPWRRTRDRYAVWVAEVMSAQTTVGRAGAAWAAWMARWPTIEGLAAASLSDVLRQWQGLGYPRRARDLHRSARIVVADGWPGELTELPGVGPYVAAAIRCFALEQPVLPVDVNVARVLGRRFPDGVSIAGDPWRAGQALMEFGQRICAARARCGECPVAAGCAGPRLASGTPSGARPGPRSGARPGPRSGARPRPRQPRFEGSLRQRRGRLLREVLASGGKPYAAAHREAAEGLIADGLLRRAGGWLRPPH